MIWFILSIIPLWIILGGYWLFIGNYPFKGRARLHDEIICAPFILLMCAIIIVVNLPTWIYNKLRGK